MPTLPQAVYERRLESELREMRSSGYQFTVSPDKTEYTVQLKARALQKSAGHVTFKNLHNLGIKLKRSYPYAGSIEATWLTPIFHPNIRASDGKVCIQLVNEWAASQTVVSVVKAIEHMLENPNPLSPLNKEAADFFLRHPDAMNGSFPEAGVGPRGPRILSQK